MTDRRIRVQDRAQALGRLDAMAWELNQISAWLGEHGIETEADMLEQSARGILAACWLLSRPIRPEPHPERWQQAAAHLAVDGYPRPS